MNQRSKIAILGYGVEGNALLKYLLNHDFNNITVCDKNLDLPKKMPTGVSVRLGESYLDNLEDFEYIFRSPGIQYFHPSLQLAKNKGSIITSTTKYFIEHCPCPIIGVSGTKGKGTTSTLIFEILKKAGKDVYLGGNIGVPPLEFFDNLKGNSLVVLELSSFQLQDLEKSPRYAVFLNTTSDHLDYHKDVDEYMQAKEALIAHQHEDSLAIFNKDYPYVQFYENLVKGELAEVSLNSQVKNGAYLENGEIFYAQDGKSEKIMKAKDVALIGSHNFENVLPSIVMAKKLEVKNDVIEKVISNFKGLPNRLEIVKESKNIKFVNDSFSTNPSTSMAAIDSFDEDTVLMAGGYDKGLDYSQWALKILTKPSLKAVVLMGDTQEKMYQSLKKAEEDLDEAEGSPTKIVKRDTFEQAFEEAKKMAFQFAEKSGSAALVMSPATASFDMFKSYKERGEKFRELVKD